MENSVRASLLKNTWKSSNEYTYAYVLITNKYSSEDILTAQKNKKLFFGGGIRKHTLSMKFLLRMGYTLTM